MSSLYLSPKKHNRACTPPDFTVAVCFFVKYTLLLFRLGCLRPLAKLQCGYEDRAVKGQEPERVTFGYRLRTYSLRSKASITKSS